MGFDSSSNIADVRDYKSYSVIQRNEEGEVLAYKKVQGYTYPFVLMKPKDAKFEEYKMTVLKGMVGKQIEEGVQSYTLYLELGKMGRLKVGMIDGGTLGILKNSEVFSNFDYQVWLSADAVLEGDMVFALT